MIGLGSIVNAAAIVAGGCVGLVAGKTISERARATLVIMKLEATDEESKIDYEPIER